MIWVEKFNENNLDGKNFNGKNHLDEFFRKNSFMMVFSLLSVLDN